MKWKYYNPKFEFSEEIFSAWWGHTFFAYDLVRNVKPKRIVELGTHNGVSFFSFCQATKDVSVGTELNAVDTWKGDEHANFYGEDVFDGVKKIREKYYSKLDVHFLRKMFDDAIADFEDKSIDILHIDGLHTYDAVKHDFNSWVNKVSDEGVILFHDIHEKKDDFGVYELWNELRENYDTLEFYHWHGLGILFMKNSPYNMIMDEQDEIKGHYANLADRFTFDMLKVGQNNCNKKDKQIQQKDKQIQQKDKQLKEKDERIKQKDQQVKMMQSSQFWKMRNIYIHYKDGIKQGIDNPVLFFTFIKKRFCKLFNLKYKEGENNIKSFKCDYKIKSFKFTNFEEKINAKIAIIVPVYNAYEETVECVNSILKNTKKGSYNLFLINDKSTDERIGKYLSKFIKNDNVTVVRNESNLGFVKTVNKGIKMVTGDVILLNSDTKVTKNWLQKMTIAAYSDKNVGTVTPFSNAAGAFSVPETGVNKDLPLNISLSEMSYLVERSSRFIYPTIPTGNGFCMFIKKMAIDDIGFFDEENFGLGYGEENDFCMRAKAKGWKNVIDDSTFIYHKRSASFSSEKKKKLIIENRKKIDELHPTYTEEVKAFINSKEIEMIKTRIKKNIDKFSNNYNQKINKRILYVLHEGSGGVPNTNNDLMKNIQQNGYDTFVLTGDTKTFKLYQFIKGELCFIKQWILKTKWDVKNFAVSEYNDIYFDILFSLKIDIVHIRHLFKHSFDMVDLCKVLNIKIVLSFHDFYYICPSFHLITENGTYCEGNCLDCKEKCRIPTPLVQVEERLQDWTTNVWRKNVEKMLNEIDFFVTTSDFTKKQYEKIYPLLQEKKFSIIAHGRDFEYINQFVGKNDGDKIKILIPGNIEFHKGSAFIDELLLFDKDNKLEIHCIGKIDEQLQKNNRIIYHGTYKREEFRDLVKKIEPSFIGIFSICPETYSHTLTEAWSCGVPCIVTNIGAIEERVRRTGGGIIVDRNNVSSSYKNILDNYNNKEKYKTLLSNVHTIPNNSTFAMSLEYLKLYKQILYKDKKINLINILTHGSDGKYPPSTYIRVISPVLHNELIDENSVILHNQNIKTLLYDEVIQTNKYIFVQRDCIDENILNYIKTLQSKYNYKMIFEIDDDIVSINKLHPEYSKYKNKIKLIQSISSQSDILISTRGEILDKLKVIDNKKNIIPNYLDEKIWFTNDKKKINKEKDNVVKIGYIGSFTHDADIKMIDSIITDVKKDINSQNGASVEFYLIGGTNSGISSAKSIKIPTYRREYPDFVKWCIENLDLDIGIAPLNLENKLNYSKSYLKYLEYSALGLPAVYTKIPSYAEVIKDGINGFVIEENDVVLWKKRLIELILDKKLRDKIAKNAKNDVIKNHLLRAGKLQWHNIFKNDAK